MNALEELELFEQNNKLEAELREKEKENAILEDKLYLIKNTRKKIKIGLTTFITIVSIASGAMAHSLYNNYKMIREGKAVITNNVYESCMDGIGWRDYTNGTSFNIGKTYVTYEELLSTLRLRARANEISDIDLYIGISNILNKEIAEDLVGKMDSEAIESRAYEVYLSEELESVRNNGK